jgi:hypothetical protein
LTSTDSLRDGISFFRIACVPACTILRGGNLPDPTLYPMVARLGGGSPRSPIRGLPHLLTQLAPPGSWRHHARLSHRCHDLEMGRKKPNDRSPTQPNTEAIPGGSATTYDIKRYSEIRLGLILGVGTNTENRTEITENRTEIFGSMFGSEFSRTEVPR